MARRQVRRGTGLPRLRKEIMAIAFGDDRDEELPSLGEPGVDARSVDGDFRSN
jgi:hypothetical protein